MRFLTYGFIGSIIILALGIYFRQTYLMVCCGGGVIIFGLLYLILGYPTRVEKKLQAKLAAGERLTPEEMTLLLEFMTIEKKSSPTPWNPFQLNYVSPARVFLEQAEKFERRREKKAVFVPFKAYEPTYNHMNKPQQRWYFYWRHQVRQGKYSKTSLSYILVHAYELINGIGTTDTRDGYEQLHRLWLKYRTDCPQLDNSLLDWLADCVVVEKLQIDPLTIYAELARQTEFYFSYVDLILPAYLDNALDQMPLPVIDVLTDHKISQSKFYQAGHDQLLATTLPQVIAQVDVHLRRQGKGIFERYRPKKKTAIRRPPFVSAIYDGSRNPITIAKVYLYADHQPLRRFLTGVIKHAENLLRQQYDHRGRLRVDDLDEDIKRVIEFAVFAGGATAKPAEYQVGKPGSAKKRGVPIPSRQAKEMYVEPGKSSPLEQLWAKGFFSNKLSFTEQARELVDHREAETIFIKFGYSFPEHNYNMMLLPQLKWYFYWRGQAREGHYLPTDLGYLFVYMREVINNIGVEDPKEGYKQILNIWRHYHQEHKAIDYEAPLWAGDYIVVNKLSLHPLHIYAEPAMQAGVLRYQPDYAVAIYLTQPFVKWPVALIERLADHRLTKSPFYQSGHAELVDEYIPQTVAHVDQFLKKRAGQGIFEQFQPEKPEVIKRAPFYNLTYKGSNKPISITAVYPFTEHQPLRDFLTPLVKHIENNLRDLKNYRGRLRVTGLDDEVMAVVDRFIARSHEAINPPSPKPKIKIDLSRIEQLRQESEHVFNMLQLEEDEDMVERPEAGAEAEAEAEAKAKVEAAPQPATEAPVSVAADEFEDEAWAELAAQLTTPQINALVAIIVYDDPTDAIRQIAADQHTMPTVILDSINELAQDLIGDILVEANPSPHIIDDYYVEMIDQIVTNRS